MGTINEVIGTAERRQSRGPKTGIERTNKRMLLAQNAWWSRCGEECEWGELL